MSGPWTWLVPVSGVNDVRNVPGTERPGHQAMPGATMRFSGTSRGTGTGHGDDLARECPMADSRRSVAPRSAIPADIFCRVEQLEPRRGSRWAAIAGPVWKGAKRNRRCRAALLCRCRGALIDARMSLVCAPERPSSRTVIGLRRVRAWTEWAMPVVRSIPALSVTGSRTPNRGPGCCATARWLVNRGWGRQRSPGRGSRR